MNEKYEQHRDLLGKWLWILFCAGIAGLVCSALNMIPVVSEFSLIGSRIVSVLTIVVMFMLAPVHERYRKAAIFLCVSFACTLGYTLLGAEGVFASLLNLASSVCSLIAIYQEFCAHADVAESYDSGLSAKWHKLFNWHIWVGVLSYVATLFVLIPVVGIVALLVIGVAAIVLEILYLQYLNRMVKIFKQ